MQSSDQPTRISIPFANTGIKRPIPTASQIGISAGAASFTDGFPPLNFTPLAAGGVPPAGADFNGVLNAITDIQQWQSAGGLFKFDAAFATSVGGYPAGARLVSADNSRVWLSLVENNVTDPDGVGAAGWHSVELQQMPTYATLRAYAGSAVDVYITGALVTTAPAGIAGNFILDAADTTAVDNGATVIVTASGKRYKRAYSGPANVRWWGVIGNSTTSDQTAMQAALDSLIPLYIPANCWIKTTASLVYHPNQVLFGDEGKACGIVATGFTYPVFVTDTAPTNDFVGGYFGGFTVRNGTTGMLIQPSSGGATTTQSLCVWSDVRFEFQSTIGISCLSTFIGNTLRNVVFFYCVRGIYTAKQANLNLLDSCRWEGLDDISVNFDCVAGAARGGENNVFINARVEARNTAGMTGKRAIQLLNCHNTQFIGGYFENTFRTVLYERGGSGTKFQGVWFTGEESEVAPAGLKQEIFDSDAIVTFDSNDFLTGSKGAARMVMLGVNRGLNPRDSVLHSLVSDSQSKFKINAFPFANGVVKPIISFQRASASGDLNNQQSLTGRVLVNIFATTTDGNPVVVAREYLINIVGFASGPMAAVITAGSVADSLSGIAATFALSSVAGPGGASTEIQLVGTFTCPNFNASSCVISFDVTQNFGPSFPAISFVTLV